MQTALGNHATRIVSGIHGLLVWMCIAKQLCRKQADGQNNPLVFTENWSWRKDGFLSLIHTSGGRLMTPWLSPSTRSSFTQTGIWTPCPLIIPWLFPFMIDSESNHNHLSVLLASKSRENLEQIASTAFVLFLIYRYLLFPFSVGFYSCSAMISVHHVSEMCTCLLFQYLLAYHKMWADLFMLETERSDIRCLPIRVIYDYLN